MKKHKAYEDFAGKINRVSVSPHGDPEGIVLATGEFVKIPPHTLIAPQKIRVGAKVSGTAERFECRSLITYRHPELFVGEVLVANDQLKKHKDEEAKEAHHEHVRKLKKTQSVHEKRSVTGEIYALAFKKEGELERILLVDGTSVHVAKDLELEAIDFAVGMTVKVKGEARDFGNQKFLKAKHVSLAEKAKAFSAQDSK